MFTCVFKPLDMCLKAAYVLFIYKGLICVFFPQQKAFLTSALVIGALFFLCSLVLFLGVKEQQGESFRGGPIFKYTINKNILFFTWLKC